MKSNSYITRSLSVVLLGLLLTTVQSTFGQQLAPQLSDVQLQTLVGKLANTPQLPPDQAPKNGNFYFLSHPEWPPLPGNPGIPVWRISGTTDSYLLDDAGIDSGLTANALEATVSVPAPPGGGTNGGGFSIAPDISNYAKYAAEAFLIISTNDPSIAPSLFNACASFRDTNTNPTLQIVQYQPGCLLFKASHFDYSAETRNFALVVCDKLNTPLFKSIDISNPTNNMQNGGWLVQGSVASWQVANPMFLMVSNVSRTYNAFFRVIPYDGPTVQLTGPNPYDVVSNTIALKASIADLSGVTNESLDINVDDNYARYSVSNNNTIFLQSPYNPNGPCTIYVNASSAAQINALTNVPTDVELTYSGSGSVPVDFENDTYMAFSGNNSSTNAGTTYSLFVVNKAQDITATIYDPSNGHPVASFGGHTPGPVTVEIPWNFTEADGVTPYTNDTYVVHFIAYDPSDMSVTNIIRRDGVRVPGGNIVTYEYEDPSVSIGPSLNAAADKYVYSLEVGLYENLYDRHMFSTTQYGTGQIGVNRENDPNALFPWILQQSNENTFGLQVGSAFGNGSYSDFTWYSGHANGTELGGGPPGSHYINTYLASSDVARISRPHGVPNWRFRKVALWGCYTEADPDITAGGTYSTWPQAFGIQKGRDQINGMTPKNVGLFFHGGFPQAGYQNTQSGASVEVAVQFDMLWVMGPNQYAGGCNPTYAFSWALHQIRSIDPELDIAHSEPTLEGFPYLPYAGVYEGELMTNDVEHVTLH